MTQSTLSILLPAARRSAPGEEQSCWGDLRVALASVAAYAPGVDVVVGWNGAEEPRDLPPNAAMRLMRQGEGIRTGSDAWNWCAQQTDASYLLILGDDTVLHPDTLGLLLEDGVGLAREFPGQVAFVGARSNYVKGPQNIRSANGSTGAAGILYESESQVFELPMIVPVAALISHAVYDEVGGFASTNWFADDLMCWDLSRRGYRHFVSRAYVHHVGQRATAQGKTSADMWREGWNWLEANRPDFVAHLDAQGMKR